MELDKNSVYNSSSNFLFSSIKKVLYDLFPWTCMLFAIRLHVSNCNSSLFLNKSNFPGGISGYFFKFIKVQGDMLISPKSD